MQDSQLKLLLLLRVIATVLVVLGHAGAIFSGVDVLRAPVSMNVQSAAVTLFFGISGWTIAWVLDRIPDYSALNLVRFLFDRLLRLAVPLVPVLLVFGACEAVILGSANPYAQNLSITALVGNLLFLQGLPLPLTEATFPPFGLNRPLWTISIEFWIYVFFGGLLFLVRGRARLLAGLAALAGLLLTYTFFLGGRGEGLASVWMCGALAYFLRDRVQTRLAIVVLIASSLALFVPAVWPANGNYSPLYNLILSAWLSAALLAVRDRQPLRIPLVQAASNFAYTVYLTHYPLLLWVQFLFPEARGSLLAVSLTGGAFFCGWLISFTGERHYRTVRRKAWNVVMAYNAWLAAGLGKRS